MPVIDPAAIAGVLADLGVSILTYAGIAGILYAIGGILIRTVSWTFDKLLVTFIGYVFKYFETIIDGTLLTDTVVKGMMDRVYLLVGVFVVVRLGMLLFNYIINPSEVMDEKVGVSALVKRVILGLIMIIFMPSIFGFAFRIQKAILNDQVIERIIMPEETIADVTEYKEKHGMGKIIAMTIEQGFFSISSSAKKDKQIQKAYNRATNIESDYDLSVIDSLGFGLNSGILYEKGDEYAFDYFPIFSTVVLCYVLYLLVQYCLDAVVRSFKLSVLQVIAPVAIVEYMINSDRNEVFKSWRKAVVATFAMLFMRVASIWFVAYVTMLMQPGMIDSASLLQTDDNLLKALIVLGLLAFMMDFPKLMSDVFGLDLDQSGSVKNVMGKAMGAAAAGLAIGGAAVGAMAKPMKGLTKAGLQGVGSMGSVFANSDTGKLIKDKVANSKVGQGLSSMKNNMSSKVAAAKNKIAGSKLGQAANKFNNTQAVKDIKSSFSSGVSSASKVAKGEHVGTALKTGALAMGSAILASNAVTKSAAGGYQQSNSAVEGKVSSAEAKQREEQAAATASAQLATANAQLEQQQAMNLKMGYVAEIDGQITDVNFKGMADGIKDINPGNTVLGNLQNMNQTMDVTRDTVVNISDNVQTVANTTNTISQNMNTVVENTNTITQNTNTMVEQNQTMSQTLNKIEDNTMYTGVDSINSMQDSGYINKPLNSSNGSQSQSSNKPTNNNAETL